MFATILETVLIKHLGKYLDGIKKNMDISILNGEITIDNLSIKPEFINELELPFILRFSHINKILINVPWANLKEKQTTVTIQGIYALLSLKYNEDDLPNLKDPRQQIKQIVTRVKEELKKKWQDKSSGKSETFAEKSLLRIIDNLCLNIDEIHIRIESIKRNWDFSIGVIIDNISSITVNQFGQKFFYTRHFIKKVENQTLRKSLNCGRVELYFNDKEQFFMSWQVERGKEILLKMMAEPFGSKSLVLANLMNSKKSKGSQTKLTNQAPKAYISKILTYFSIDVILQQKQSADFSKYLIQVKAQLPKIELKLSDRQLSQIIVVLQLFYQWQIDILKNGRRIYNWDEKIEEYYKGMIRKLVGKEQKLTEAEWRDLEKIVMENPISQLQNSADALIKSQRISKEMSKINKITNKQKSQEMVSKLFEKIEQEDLQTLQIFDHIIIHFSLPQLKIACYYKNLEILNVGFISLVSELKLVLGKNSILNLHISEIFFEDFQPDPRNLVDFKNLQKQPFLQFGFSQTKAMPPIIKLSIKKRQITIYQKTLENLFEWVSLIKMKPPLLNFLDEQLNYSIYITKEIFSMLFSHQEASLNVHIEIPELNFALDNHNCSIIKQQQILINKKQFSLTVNLGTLQIQRQTSDEYTIHFSEPQSICMNGSEIICIKEGTKITLLNIEPQAVDIEFRQIQIKNHFEMIKFGVSMIENRIIKLILGLDIVLEQQIKFQGLFMLNEFKKPQTMLLKGNYLQFYPSGARISLLKTKMYRFLRNGGFGLIFREEVEKQINIVMINSENHAEKIMDTLFVRLKEQILYICTYSQWNKYHRNFQQKIIQDIFEIQYQEENKKLIDLLFAASQIDILFDTLDSTPFQTSQENSRKTKLSLNKFKGSIGYRQYNTDADGQIGSLSFVLNGYKILSNLSIKVSYSYINFMSLLFDIISLKFNIEEYSILDDAISIMSCYILRINELVAAAKKLGSIKSTNIILEENRVSEKNTSNSIKTKTELEYLLEARFEFSVKNVEGDIIGYKSSIKKLAVQILKYRNMCYPFVMLELDKLLFLSAVRVKKISLQLRDNDLAIQINQIFISLAMQLIIYEMTAGKGHRLVNSMSNLLRFHWTVRKQEKQIKQISKHVIETVKQQRVGKPFKQMQPADELSIIEEQSILLSEYETIETKQRIKVAIDVKHCLFQIKLIESEDISVKLAEINVSIDPNQKPHDQHLMIKNQISLKWNGLSILNNDCVIMEPNLGEVQITNHFREESSCIEQQPSISLNLGKIMINCPLYRLSESSFIILKVIDKIKHLPIITNISTFKEQKRNIEEINIQKRVVDPNLKIYFEGFIVKLLNQKSRQLIRIRTSELNLSSQSFTGNRESLIHMFNSNEDTDIFNKLAINMEYMNQNLWMYEPILENFQVQFIITQIANNRLIDKYERNQRVILVNISEVRVAISHQLILSLVKEIMVTQQNIERLIVHQAQQFEKYHGNSRNYDEKVTQAAQYEPGELEKYKRLMDAVLLTDEQLEEGYFEERQGSATKNKEKIYSPFLYKQQPDIKKYNKLQVSNANQTYNTLILQNCLHSDMLIQVSIQKQKSQFYLGSPHPNAASLDKREQHSSKSQINFKIKSEYRESYQIIQKYRKIIVKITMIHPIYSAHSLFYSVVLHNEGYAYHPVRIIDDMGNQVNSAIGITVVSCNENIEEQENSKYILKVVSPIKITNQSRMDLTVRNKNRSRSQFHKDIIKHDSSLFLQPWTMDQITIHADQHKNPYSSGYDIDLRGRSIDNINPEIYEINLNKQLNQTIYNYTALSIIPVPLLLVDSQNIRHENGMRSQKTDLLHNKQNIFPVEFVVRPTYYVLSHLHVCIKINESVCVPGKKQPLYIMYKDGGKCFLQIRLGDGSMHEVYVPNYNEHRNVELKLKGDNFIKLSIFTETKNGTDADISPQFIFHVFTHLQLTIKFPRLQQTQIFTKIYGNIFLLNKELVLNQNSQFQDQFVRQEHPKRSNDQYHHFNLFDQQKQQKLRNLGCIDRFSMNSSLYLLGQYEKYLTIQTTSWKSQEIVLYPSYYGNQLFFYQLQEKKSKKPKCHTCGYLSCICSKKQIYNTDSEAIIQSDLESVMSSVSNMSKKPPSSSEGFFNDNLFLTKDQFEKIQPPTTVYSITYGTEKITSQISTFNVTICPKYYIINLAMDTHFMIEGTGSLRYKDRIVLKTHEKIQISLLMNHSDQDESQSNWQILGKIQEIDLIDNKEIIYFKSISFDDHEAFEAIRRHTIRDNLCRKRKLSNDMNLEKFDHENIRDFKMGFNTQNLSIYQLFSHSGSCNTINYFIKEWASWIKIHNNLPYTLKIVSKKQEIQQVSDHDPTRDITDSITYFTYIKPQQIKLHPYGLRDYDVFVVYLINEHKEIEIGEYDINMRLNDCLEIEIDAPSLNGDDDEHNPLNRRVSGVIRMAMNELRVSEGRKIIFRVDQDQYINPLSYPKDNEIIQELPTVKVNKKQANSPASLHLLKISQSLTLNIGIINISYFGNDFSMDKQKKPNNPKRRQLFKVNVTKVCLLLLQYPSSLYMLNISTQKIIVHSSNFLKAPILYIPGIQVYVEGVEGRFKQRLSLNIKKKNNSGKSKEENQNRIKIFITDRIIFGILKEIKSITKFSEKEKEKIMQKSHFGKHQSLNQVKGTSQFAANNIYVSTLNSLFISPITLEVTIRKILAPQDHINDEESRKVLEQLGLSIMELDESVISLSSVDISEPVSDKHIKEVSKMYIIELIVGCLGGLNLIGNPKKFIEEIETGKTKGGVFGFLRGVLAGTTNSLSLILSTVGNGISSLSMDSQYQRERNQLYLTSPEGFLNGVKSGAKGLFNGFKSGIVGVVQKPIQAVKQEGGSGILKGTFEGIAGLVIKPITGVMDAASLTIHGIKSSSSYMTQQQLADHLLSLERPMYHKFKAIRPYDQTDQILFNCFKTILKSEEGNENLNSQNIELVEAFQLEDDNCNKISEGVVITCDNLYLINTQDCEIVLKIRNQWISGTGKFLEGVVLYFEDGKDDEDQLVFRMQASDNAVKKQRLYWTLKAFINLHKDTSGDPGNQLPD